MAKILMEEPKIGIVVVKDYAKIREAEGTVILDTNAAPGLLVYANQEEHSAFVDWLLAARDYWLTHQAEQDPRAT